MMDPDAKALWIVGPGRAELRSEPAPQPIGDQVVVRSLFGAISRGTEALVLAGAVPASEVDRMRCPFQQGEFPFPVKYGYAAVGLVEQGPNALIGQAVFCLHPHQDRFTVPAGAVFALPPDLPPGRAVLAANAETALNVVWDARIGIGDRVAVIGAGVVGSLVAWLVGEIPGVELILADINPARRATAEDLGVRFADPSELPPDCDVVINASGQAAGLQTAIATAGFEAAVVEASWYGDREISIGLGGAFHSRRLRIVSSQVGAVSAARRGRWSHNRRLAKALELLGDPRLDSLVSGESAFADLDRDYAAALAAPDTLCHRIRY